MGRGLTCGILNTPFVICACVSLPQETASTSDMTMDVDEEDTDEPVDSGLECSDDFAADGQCDDMNVRFFLFFLPRCL